jgi:regulatory protein
MPLPLQSTATLSLKGRALRALAGREHSRAELVRKLASFEAAPGELEAVLDDLSAKGYINEQRVADSLAHRRGAKLGTARVVQELKAKGVQPEAVAQAAAALKATELERAREVWRKKFGKLAGQGAGAESTSAAERVKQMRFLASRGFAAEVIRKAVGGASDAGEDEYEGDELA